MRMRNPGVSKGVARCRINLSSPTSLMHLQNQHKVVKSASRSSHTRVFRKVSHKEVCPDWHVFLLGSQ